MAIVPVPEGPPPESRGLLPTLCHIVNYLRAILADLISAVVLAILFPLNLERFDPKKKEDCDPNQTPILLIHGFLGSSNNWVYHRFRLLRAGHRNIFTVNLGDPRKSIVEYAKTVAARTKEIQKITGRSDLILVSHSMGGLVAQQYMYNEPGAKDRVKKIITIGTPCLGTPTAHLASWVSSAAEEMIPGSELLGRLQQAVRTDTTTNYVHIGTKTDAIVRPLFSSLGIPRPRSSQHVLQATGHIHFLFSPAVADQLESSLGASV